MSSPLLGIVLIAVIWLAMWSVKDHSRPSQTWWPFAMRKTAEAVAKQRQGQYIPGQSEPSGRKPVLQVWRRSRS
jgi:hypothetical protein